jgi:hypothetical protein
VKILSDEKNPLFDDIVKNLENNQDLYYFINSLVLGLMEYKFKMRSPVVELAFMYGIIERGENGYIKIHNRIFDEVINDYLIEKNETEATIPMLIPNRNDYIDKKGKLDFKKVLLKFQEFIKANQNKDDLMKSDDFLERGLRLVFLSFIKSVINGKGFSFNEAQTGEEKRLDVVVVFNNEKYIVELKIWHGENAHQQSIKQLKHYLELESVKKGYMLILNKNKKKKFYHEEKNGLFMVFI